MLSYHKKEHFSSGGGEVAGMFFAMIWVFLGLAGFVFSLICFGKSGTTGQHVVGLILSILFGPIYWIFYLAMGPTYCK